MTSFGTAFGSLTGARPILPSMRTPFAPLLLLALLTGGPAVAQTWASLPPMGTARKGAAGAVLDGRLFVIGGADAAGTPLGTVEAYDPASGWSTVASLNDPRTDAAAAVYDGQIVVVGGRDERGEPSDKAEVYNAERDRWESFDALDEHREGLGAAVVNGGLYAFGGAGEGGVLLATMEAYGGGWGRYEEWTLSPPRARFGFVSVGDALILAGGYSTFGPISRVDRYVPYQPGTAELPSLPEARGALALAVAPGMVFALGGRDASDQVRADVDLLLLTGGDWQAMEPLPRPREGAVSAVIGADLYVVGGADGYGSVLNSAVRLAGVAVDGEEGPEAPGLAVRLAGPNPVRAVTAFEVEVPRPGRVRLVVIDVLGREVGRLQDADLSAGTRRVEWEAAVAPGVYTVRLDGPGGMAAITVTVVR